MRGRDVFARNETLLHRIEAFVDLFPARLRLFAFDVVRNWPTRPAIALRYVLLRTLAASCGRVVAVYEGVYLKNISGLQVGNNVSIHPMCYLDASAGLRIGDDVSIAHGVTIMTTEHNYIEVGANIRDAPVTFEPTSIGNDVWIGAGVKVLGGVRIGDHVAIGAGAVVTKSIPSGSLAVGVPARVIKQIRSSDEIDPVL